MKVFKYINWERIFTAIRIVGAMMLVKLMFWNNEGE